MSKVLGYTFGLKQAEIKAIEKLYRRRISQNEFVSFDVLKELSGLCDATGRSIGITVDRKGKVKGVWVGDNKRVHPEGLIPPRFGPGRFSGLRYIYVTENKDGVSEIDSTEAARLRMDSWIRVETSGKGSPKRVWILVPDPIGVAKSEKEKVLEGVRTIGPLSPHGIPKDFIETIKAVEDELEKILKPGITAERPVERALLVGVYKPENKKQGIMSLHELERLARSALMEVVGKEVQLRQHPDASTWLGSGFIQELIHHSARLGATIIVADSELSPVQIRNLSESIGLPVIDRVWLILNIFKRRAKTKDAKMRVELARLKYELSRLKGLGKELSQIGGTSGGTVGVRGKGEPKTEILKRKLREKIQRLKEKIRERTLKRRETRKRRLKSGIPIVSIIGYTNAGKTTIFNELTGAKGYSENLLFATLDPMARRLYLPSSKKRVILTDTVGFLKSLPEGLVDAFRATLEELRDADLFLHIIDISVDDWQNQKRAVEETLRDLNLSSIPIIEIYNKADLINRNTIKPIVDKNGGMLVCAFDSNDRALIIKKIEEILFKKTVF